MNQQPHRQPSRSLRTGFAAALALGLALPARADEAASPPAAEAPPPASAEDAAANAALEEELRRALQADEKERAEQQPVAQPTPAPVARSFQSMNPDISLIGDFALAWFTDPAPRQTGGHDPLGNGFNLQAVEIAFGAAVDPYLRMDANLAFTPEGEFEIEEGYATTLALPANLQLRMGQMLARFGRINQRHPHQWDFVDQPFVIGKMLGEDGLRGVAFEASLLLPLPWYVELVFAAQNAQTARSFFGETERLTRTPLDLVYLADVKQFFPFGDDWSLAWGLSSAVGPGQDGLHARTEIWGTDLYLKYRPVGEATFTTVSLTIEGLARRRHAYDADGTGIGPTLVDYGGYAQLVWRFDQRWTTGLRGELVTGVEGDPIDPDWVDTRWRVSANVTFFPTEFSRVRLQANHDQETWAPDPVDSVMLAFEFSAGAHGAHAF